MKPLRLVAFVALSFPCFAGDWPQFRGPGGTAVAADAKIPAKPKID